MNFTEEFDKLTHDDQNQFQRVVNVLLLKTFIVREVFDHREKMMRTNPDYRFFDRHMDLVNEYLDYSGWRIEKDDLNGVIILLNLDNQNRIRLDRETSLLIYVLRLIYEKEKSESYASGESVYMTTPNLVKTMLDYAITIPNKRLTGRSLARSLRLLVNHNIIARVSGTFDEGNVNFYILPSIIHAIDQNKLTAMSEAISQMHEADDSAGGEGDLY